MATALHAFDQIYIINLPTRQDRREEMVEQLARAGLTLDDPKVTLFPAVRPNDPEPFDRVGVRGAFLSHLGVLKEAKAKGHGQILILEDDADFTQALLSADDEIIERLYAPGWDMAYLGHLVTGPAPSPSGEAFDPVLAPTPIMLAHALCIRTKALEGLIPYLEAMLARPAGDPAGGPMHVDGAYGWFRKDHPDITTLISRDQLIVQRASKTDIHAPSWKEKLPFINMARRLKNKLAQR